MNESKYNTRVRCAISEQYVKKSMEKQELTKEYAAICGMRNVDEMPHGEYVRMVKRIEEIKRELEILDIQINTWSEAREICLDIADEM